MAQHQRPLYRRRPSCVMLAVTCWCAVARLTAAESWRILYDEPDSLAGDGNTAAGTAAAGPAERATDTRTPPAAAAAEPEEPSAHEQVAALLEAADGAISQYMPELGILFATGDPDTAREIRALPGVASVTRVTKRRFWDAQTYHTGTTPITSHGKRHLRGRKAAEDETPDLLPLQWGLEAIDAGKAFEAGLTGGGDYRPKVAVMDGGYWLEHPSIASNINMDLSKNFIAAEALAYDAGNNDGDPFSHGTWTASIIAGAHKGQRGTRGVAPEAELVLIKVLSDDGSGTDAPILAGLRYAVDSGVDIINMSLGLGPLARDDEEAQALLAAYKRAVHYAQKRGVPIIAAAGNDRFDYDNADGKVYLPQSIAPAGLIVISATGPTLIAEDPNTTLTRLAKYSSFGASTVDFAAPGGDVRGWTSDKKCSVPQLDTTLSCWELDYVIAGCCFSEKAGYHYMFDAGTSAAAPFASGVAALIVSKKGRRMDADALMGALQETAEDLGDKGDDSSYGWGMVNAGNVLRL